MNPVLAPQVRTAFRDAQKSITQFDIERGKYLYRRSDGKYRVVHDRQSRGGFLRGLLDRATIKRTNEQMRASAERILSKGNHNPEVIMAADFFLRRDCTKMHVADYRKHLAVLARAEMECDSPSTPKAEQPVTSTPSRPLPPQERKPNFSLSPGEKKTEAPSRERFQSNWTRGTVTDERVEDIDFFNDIDDILDGGNK